VLTTSIALETNLGNFDVAIAYAILLMVIVFAITLTLNLVERLRQEERTHVSVLRLCAGKLNFIN
jgi:ABC-type Fe3+ transport system permease subunit